MSASTAYAKHDVVRDIEAAERTHTAIARRPGPNQAPDLLSFAASLQLFVSIGYMSADQAKALLDWFQSSGATTPPALPNPADAPSPSAYEVIATAIHFRQPTSVDFDIFSDFFGAVGDLVSTITTGIGDVLHEGTGLLQAGAQLVHELSAF